MCYECDKRDKTARNGGSIRSGKMQKRKEKKKDGVLFLYLVMIGRVNFTSLLSKLVEERLLPSQQSLG